MNIEYYMKVVSKWLKNNQSINLLNVNSILQKCNQKH